MTVLKGFDDTASPNFGLGSNGSLTGRRGAIRHGLATEWDMARRGVHWRSSELWCAMNGSWLAGGHGEWTVGNGQTSGTQSTLVLVDLPAGRTAIAVAVGSEAHSCALLDNRSVVCWGFDDEGQLGNGAGTSDQATPTYVDLPNDGRVVRLTAGRDHTCAILDNGSLWCWGRGNEGQLGNGATSDRAPSSFNCQQDEPNERLAGTTRVCGPRWQIVSCWGQNVNGHSGSGPRISSAFHTRTCHVAARSRSNAHTACLHLRIWTTFGQCWGDHPMGVSELRTSVRM